MNRAGDAPWGLSIADFSSNALDIRLSFIGRPRCEDEMGSFRWSDTKGATMLAPEGKAARPQPDTICSGTPSEDGAPPLLMDRGRAAEECIDSFIDTAARSLEK
jgi:hypothetical protein